MGTLTRIPDSGDKIHYGEVIDPRIADVEALARWLDYAFTLPGGFRFGLAGLIGLIPGFGDIFDALVSLYIVGRAVQIGVPRVTVVRMVMNVGIESLIGAVPFLGAVFDTVFKANRRNYLLLANHLGGPRRNTAHDWWFVAGVGTLLFVSALAPLVVLYEVFRMIGAMVR